MKAGRTIACLAGILVLVVAGVALAGGWDRFAHGKAEGPDPVAQAGDVVQNPHKLMAKITTRPSNRRIGAKYGTRCAKGNDVGSRGHKFKGRTPVKRDLGMRFSNPDACEVSVIAATEGNARIKIELFVKRQ
jgi:hypothetical protein